MANPQQKSNREHSFDSELASLVGIEKAILVKNIAYWVDENERRKIESSFAYGKWWTFESLTSLSIKYPYMKRGNLSRWFKELKRDGWIVMFSTTDGSNMYAPGPVFNAWNLGKDWQGVFQNETGRAWGEVFQNEPKAAAQNETEGAAQNETHNNVENNIEKDIELEGEREVEKMPPPQTFEELMQRVNEQAEQLKALKPITKPTHIVTTVEAVELPELPKFYQPTNHDAAANLLNRLEVKPKASTVQQAHGQIVEWCHKNPEAVRWCYEVGARRKQTADDLHARIVDFIGCYGNHEKPGTQLLFWSDPVKMFSKGLTKWLQKQNDIDRDQLAKQQKTPTKSGTPNGYGGNQAAYQEKQKF